MPIQFDEPKIISNAWYDKVKVVLANLTGDKWLVASFMYNVGLRLME